MPNPNYQKFNRNLVNQRGASSGSNKVPSNIVCNVCRGRKHQSQFAGRQLGKFNTYNKAFVRDPNSVKVTCKDCTAQQTTKLTCCVCSTTKPLDGFTKSQRKNPDQARCRLCVKSDLETEPNIAPSSDESGSAGLSEPDSDFDDWETPTPPTKFTPKKPTPSAAIPKPAEKEESDPDFDDNFAALTVADKKENEHEWHVAAKSKNSNASRNNPDSSASTMRSKSGWARVTKVPTSKAARWGKDAEESDILEYPTATYGKNKGGAFDHRLVDLEDNRN